MLLNFALYSYTFMNEECGKLLREYSWEVYKLTKENGALLEAINGRDAIIIALQRQIDTLNRIIEENEQKENTNKAET